MLRALMNKVDNKKKQMNNASRDGHCKKMTNSSKAKKESSKAL
jgi:hypothetical protein